MRSVHTLARLTLGRLRRHLLALLTLGLEATPVVAARLVGVVRQKRVRPLPLGAVLAVRVLLEEGARAGRFVDKDGLSLYQVLALLVGEDGVRGAQQWHLRLVEVVLVQEGDVGLDRLDLVEDGAVVAAQPVDNGRHRGRQVLAVLGAVDQSLVVLGRVLHRPAHHVLRPIGVVAFGELALLGLLAAGVERAAVGGEGAEQLVAHGRGREDDAVVTEGPALLRVDDRGRPELGRAVAPRRLTRLVEGRVVLGVVEAVDGEADVPQVVGRDALLEEVAQLLRVRPRRHVVDRGRRRGHRRRRGRCRGAINAARSLQVIDRVRGVRLLGVAPLLLLLLLRRGPLLIGDPLPLLVGLLPDGLLTRLKVRLLGRGRAGLLLHDRGLRGVLLRLPSRLDLIRLRLGLGLLKVLQGLSRLLLLLLRLGRRIGRALGRRHLGVRRSLGLPLLNLHRVVAAIEAIVPRVLPLDPLREVISLALDAGVLPRTALAAAVGGASTRVAALRAGLYPAVFVGDVSVGIGVGVGVGNSVGVGIGISIGISGVGIHCLALLFLACALGILLVLPERIPHIARIRKHLWRGRFGVIMDRGHDVLELARIHGLFQRFIGGGRGLGVPPPCAFLLPERVPLLASLPEHLRRSGVGIVMDGGHQSIEVARIYGLEQRRICV